MLAPAALLVALCAPPPPDGASAADAVPLQVYGQAPPVSAGSREVDPLLIEHKARRTAEDLLELVPGLYVVQHGSEGKGHQLYLRGFDALHGADVEVTVEGVPINEPSNVHGHGYVDLGFIVPELVAGVEASKGVSGVEQGDFATAGSVALSLGAVQRGGRLVYELGTTGRHRAALIWAPADEDRATAAGVEVVDDPGFGAQRATRRLGAIGQYAFDLGGGEAAAWGAIHHSDFELPTAMRRDDVAAGRVAADGSYRDDTDGTSQRLIAAGRWSRRWGRLRLGLGMHAGARRLRLDEDFTGWLADPVAGDAHRQRHAALEGGGRFELRWRPTAAWRLVGLLDLRGGRLWQSQVPLPRDGSSRPADRELEGGWHRQGAGAAARWRPWPWLIVEGGARVDGWRYAVDDAINGRGDEAVWALSPRGRARASVGDWLLFGAAGRGLRPPEARAVTRPPPVADAPVDTYRGGEPAVTASDSFEVGARWSPTEAFAVTGAGFVIDIAREQIYDHVSATTVERGSTRRRGVELGVAGRPVPWLSVAADVTVVDAAFGDGRPLPGVPTLLGRLDAGLAHPDGWLAGLGALYLGRRPLGDGAEAAAAAVFDVSAGYRWPRVALELTVENVTDAVWREGEYRFASAWDRSAPRSELPVIHGFAGAPRQVRLTLTGWL